jgi:dephospho-CoA kinase
MAKMVAERIKLLAEQGKSVVVVEAAILFEAGWDSLVDEVWSTDSPEELVIGRLQARNGLSEEEARRRIGAQMSASERRRRSNVVIDNSGDLADLERAIQSLWNNRVKEKVGKV